LLVDNDVAELAAGKPDWAGETSDSGALRIAPYALLRFATLPVDMLAAMRPRRTLEAVEASLAAEAAMGRDVEGLADALFALVGRTAPEAKGLRRAALQLKREIHGLQPTGLTSERADEVLAALRRQDPAAGAALEAWIAAQAARVAADSAAEEALREELQAVLRPALRAPLANPLFRRALAMASADMARHAGRADALPLKGRPDQFERSLLSYFSRAAVKTSPFSSFMSTTALSVAERASGPLRLERLTHLCRTRLNRGLVARLHRAFQATLARTSLPLRANPTLTNMGGSRFRALSDRPLALLGRPWRQQAIATFQLHPSLSGPLTSVEGAHSPGEWRTIFEGSGVPSDRAEALPVQLLERGLLMPPWLADAYEPEPETELLALLDQGAEEGAAVARAALGAMVDICSELAAADTPLQGHAAMVARIRDLEAEAMAALSPSAPEPFQNVVLDDCWSSGARTVLGTDQLRAVTDLGDFLSTQIGISPIYLNLRDSFLARFGADGRCDDVLDFLTEVQPGLVKAVEYGASSESGPTERAPAGTRLPVTVQLQLLGGDGGPRAVANKVYEGPAWLAARFAFGDTPEHAVLRRGIGEWIETLAGSREPVDMPVSGDCNDLQAHPRLTGSVLRWPGEPHRQGEAVDLADLHLVHDEASGLLRLLRPTGAEIALFYLGAGLPSPTWGVPYALSLLAQPYQLMRPGFSPAGAGRELDDVQFAPRMEAGAVVLKRATWWVRTEWLRRTWFEERGAARLRAVRRHCAERGMPETLFARRPSQPHAAGTNSGALDAQRKPLWVDTANPFCLELLERLLDGVEWLALTEALPGPGEHWLTIDGRSHASELQVELLLESR